LHTQLYKLSKLVAPEERKSELEKLYRDQANGDIERSNRICREEFYDSLSKDTITGTRRKLAIFMDKYNSYFAFLNGLTPLEYIQTYNSGDQFRPRSGRTYTSHSR